MWTVYLILISICKIDGHLHKPFKNIWEIEICRMKN